MLKSGKQGVSFSEYVRNIDPLRKSGDWKAVQSLSETRFAAHAEGAALVHLCEALLHQREFDRFDLFSGKLSLLVPAPPDVLRLLALKAQMTGDLDKAVALWRDFLSRNEAAIDPHFRVAHILLSQRKYLDYSGYLQILKLRFPHDPRTASSESKFQAILRQTSTGALRQSAMAHMRARQWGEARPIWEMLFCVSQDDTDALVRICETHINQANFSASLKILDEHADVLSQHHWFPEIARQTLEGRLYAGEPLFHDGARTLFAMLPGEVIDPLVLSTIKRGLCANEFANLLEFLSQHRRPAAIVAASLRFVEEEQFDFAQQSIALIRAIVPKNIHHELLALRVGFRQGRLEDCRQLISGLTDLSGQLVENAPTFNSYAAIHYGVSGYDGGLDKLIQTALKTIWGHPARLFAAAELFFADGQIGLIDEIANRIDGSQSEGCVIQQVFGSQRKQSLDQHQFAVEVERLCISEPGSAEACFARIMERLLATDQTSLLELCLARAPSDWRSTARVEKVQCQFLARQGKWAEAAELWGALVARNGSDVWARVGMIGALVQGRMLDVARSAITSLTGLALDLSAALPELATWAAHAGEIEIAKTWASKSVEQSDIAKIRPYQKLLLARVFALTGNYDAARKLYEAKSPPDIGDRDDIALILDPGLTYISGHHVNYTLFYKDVVERLRDEGMALSPIVVCRENLTQTAELEAVEKYPSLTFEPYAFEKIPLVHTHLPELNDFFRRDLASLDLAGRVRLVIVHSMRAVMIDGFARWLEDVFRNHSGLVVIGLIEVDHLTQDPEIVRHYREIYKQGLARVVENPRIRSIVYVETEFGRDFLESLGIPSLGVQIYPYLAASLCKAFVKDEPGDSLAPITLGTVGGTRIDRGSQLFPEVIYRTQDLADACRWKLQLNAVALQQILKSGSEKIEQLGRYANTEIVDRTLTASEYYGLLEEIDVVILPYEERYAVSGSGVFYESIYMGKYLIVPKMTFMPAALIAMNHPHRIMEDVSISSLERAVRWVVENQNEIKRDKARLKSQKRRRYPSDEFFDLINAELAQVPQDETEMNPVAASAR